MFPKDTNKIYAFMFPGSTQEKSSQLYSGRVILITLSRKIVCVRSPLHPFVKNKRFEKIHIREKWRHISFILQKQCVLKDLFEAVIMAACEPLQMKVECKGVNRKSCFQSPLF